MLLSEVCFSLFFSNNWNKKKGNFALGRKVAIFNVTLFSPRFRWSCKRHRKMLRSASKNTSAIYILTAVAKTDDLHGFQIEARRAAKVRDQETVVRTGGP